jgi:crotonobetainyl-CoA:carnitine CoA-transferase CaiB-like acyl-CoA transferase
MLDLRDPEDHALALAYALAADVVISNFKPSSARRMGFDAEALRARQPRLIYAQLNAFADPEDESPAFDAVLQAEAGFLYMTGEPDRPPVKMPVALIDLLAAHQLKEAILLALLHRERTGQGAIVSTSLLESALASLANQAGNYLMNGNVAQRMGTRHPNIAPYGDMYPCADGKEILLAVGTERQFSQLCSALERNDLLQRPEFKTNSARVQNRGQLNEILAAILAQKTLEENLQMLKAAGVPVAQIRDMRAVFEMPEAQNMVLEETLPDQTITRRVKTIAFRLNQ